MPSTAGADVKTAAEAMNGKYQSSIVIDGLRIMARHGVWPQETTVGNMFEVSVRLDFDAAGAMMADNFGLTVSYAEVIELYAGQSLLAADRKCLFLPNCSKMRCAAYGWL